MPFDTMHACEEIAKIVDPERVMNIDQIIEKIRERFSEDMIHVDVIWNVIGNASNGLMANTLIEIMQEKQMEVKDAESNKLR